MLYSIVTLVVDAAASVLAGALLLRFWMQVVQVRPPAPLAQFIYQVSDWLVKPLRRVIPGKGGYDWASLLAAFLVVVMSVLINLGIAGVLTPQSVLVLSLCRLAEWICYGFTGLLIVEAIFSWVNPHAPLAPFVQALNEPVMRPLRRVIPPLGGIDITPLIALLILRVILQLIATLAVQAL